MKKLLVLCLALFLFLQMIPSIGAASGSESPKHIPRVVSIVFDDSGSMYKDTDRWAYTAYAMQMFTAMMGSEDTLYVTYLNAETNSGPIDLSSLNKQKTMDKLETTMFGGGTPNKLSDGVTPLTTKYTELKEAGIQAKYYLVVMADGELDDGEFAAELPKAVNKAKATIPENIFSAIYFSMADGPRIDGVKNYSASTSESIVDCLKKISTEIMGRTDVTSSCTLKNGTLSLDLPYPALSVTLFLQKNSGKYSDVEIPVTCDGRSTSYTMDTYYAECPTEIKKNLNTTIWSENIPTNPPVGFVSHMTNGDSIIRKGKYTFDLSEFNVNETNSENASSLVVLVEPAVKVDCKYYLGDSETPVSFSEIKDKLRTGDTLTIRCGLYEMNDDGTIGAPVSDDVLSPTYNLSINGKPITGTIQNEPNAYCIEVSDDYSGKELCVEASLDNYQPFILRETFGTVSPDSVILPSDRFVHEIKLTKLDWQNWKAQKAKIVFPLSYVDNNLLKDLEIRTKGYSGLRTGMCSSLNTVALNGYDLVYTPALVDGKTLFSALPSSFTIELWDTFRNSMVAEVSVKVIQPAYKFEVENGLGTTELGLDLLKNNRAEIKFTLTADYTGSGIFTAVDKADFDSDIKKITLEKGGLSGKTSDETGTVTFVPTYDEKAGDDLFQKKHTVYATATIDGKTVTSEKLVFSVILPEYKLVIENNISASLTLDTLVTNKDGIVFRVLADYNGDHEFEDLSDNDLAVYDDLKIDAGKLPGKTEKVVEGGKTVGIRFIPSYEGNDTSALSKLADTEHTVKASSKEYDLSGEIKLSVSAVSYRMEVTNDLPDKLTLIELFTNDKKIRFVPSADYDSNGTFEPLAEWDRGFIERIKLETNGFMGKTETEYDSEGNPVGISFTPFCEPDSEEAGKLNGGSYKIKANLEEKGISASVEIFLICPEYRLDVTNELDSSLSLDSLYTNNKNVLFVLTADYDGDKVFEPLAELDSELIEKIKLDTNGLMGKTQTEYDSEGNPIGISFTPFYDSDANADDLSKLVGNSFKITAVLDEKGLKSEAHVSFVSPHYEIVISNEITSPLTLDTVKNNTLKVSFKVLADYEGDGTFAPLADWDKGVYDKLKIDHGNLPGTIDLIRDPSGNVTEATFTPLYDENNNNCIVFTEVAGRTHTITAHLEGTDLAESTTVEVLSPKYTVTLKKDGITVVDIELCNNTEGVEFEVYRDARKLTKEELEGLNPYNITLTKNKKSMVINSVPMSSSDGTGYLLCTPVYKGWTFISPALWNWQSLYRVADGDMEIVFTVSDSSAAAKMHINTSLFWWAVLLIILGVLLLAAWLTFCILTRMRFTSGYFYKVTFRCSGATWQITDTTMHKSNSHIQYLTFFLPRANGKRSFELLNNRVTFVTKKDDSMFNLFSLPQWVCAKGFNRGSLPDNYLCGIIYNETDITFTEGRIRGIPNRADDGDSCDNMQYGEFVCETNGSNEMVMIFFLSNSQKKELDRYNNL